MSLKDFQDKVEEGTRDLKKTGRELENKIPIDGPIFKSSDHKKKWNISYIIWWIGVILIITSIFLPWWSFEAAVEGEDIDEQASIEMGVRPWDGPYLETPVGDLQQLADPYVTAVSVAIILPLLLPLIFGGLYGIYAAARRRVSKKLMVAPFWIVVALITWFSYYYTNSYLLSEIGLDIPATGSETLELEGYTLASASWGWGLGFYLAIAAVILLLASSMMMRKYKLPSNNSLKTKKKFSAHSGLLILFGIIYLLFGITIFWLTTQLPIPSTGAFFPMASGVVIFGMSYCAFDEFYRCPDCGDGIEIDDVKDDYMCSVCNESLYSFEIGQEKTMMMNDYIPVKANDIGKKGKTLFQDTKEQIEKKTQTKEYKKKKPTPPPPKLKTQNYEYRYCPYCGYDIRDSFHYCPKCGEELPET